MTGVERARTEVWATRPKRQDRPDCDEEGSIELQGSEWATEWKQLDQLGS